MKRIFSIFALTAISLFWIDIVLRQFKNEVGRPRGEMLQRQFYRLCRRQRCLDFQGNTFCEGSHWGTSLERLRSRWRPLKRSSRPRNTDFRDFSHTTRARWRVTTAFTAEEHSFARHFLEIFSKKMTDVRRYPDLITFLRHHIIRNENQRVM